MGILGMAEGSTVDLILGGLAFFIAAICLFLRLKAKSDKTDIMVEVDNKIAKENAPIIKRMDKTDEDFKIFKRDDIEPIKHDLNDVKRDRDVTQAILDTLVKTIERNHQESNKNHEELKEIMKERDRSYKENFLLLFKKLDSKVDKK